MPFTRRVLPFFFALLLLSPVAAQATIYEAVGIAPVDAGGIEQARRAAILDASRQAALQAGAIVEASETMTPTGLPLQAERVRAPKSFAHITVVREWREGEFLHVLIRADDRNLRDQTGSARAYKKKLLALQFSVDVPLQVADIDDFWNGFPQALMTELTETKRILPRVVKTGLSGGSQAIHSDATRAMIKILAEQNDAQFVISGILTDAGTAPEGGYWGFFKTPKRRLEIEVFVHDGLTGALLAQHRASQLSDGEPVIGRSRPFGTAAFYMTDYGKTIATVIAELREAILADLERLPFAARIIRVAGSKVFFDAGATSAIASGDKIAVYQLKNEWAINGLRVGADLGIPEVPLTTISVTQVQPLFASGEVEGDPSKLAIRVGDLVRFDTPK